MIDWSRVSELREEVGEEDFAEVVELFLDEVDGVIGTLAPETADLEAQLPAGHTALMISSQGGHEPCVRALIEAKANLELFDLFRDGQYAAARLRRALW